MKILLAGPSWDHEMYEKACANALGKMEIEVITFLLLPEKVTLMSRFEVKYSVQGPNLYRLQKELLKTIDEKKPDVVLIWLGSSVFPSTLKAIKKHKHIVLASYVHDDPFAHRVHHLSPKHHKYHWSAFIRGLKYYDIALFSKQLNVDEAYQLGAKKAGILKQYFVPEIHHPITLDSDDIQMFGCDVAFAGHFEPDWREQCICLLTEADLNVNLYSDGSWRDLSKRYNQPNFRQLPRMRGEEYTKALAGAKMCLCFMSKMNRDQYTTRCFEIPACGSLLLCERTADLLNLFKEDEEAVFFSTPEELTEKAIWLRDNPEVRDRIALAGMQRVHTDDHSVDGRMKEFLALIENRLI